jgi:hypothetical protein
MTHAKKEGWKILLPGLVSQAKSQANSEAATLQAGRPDKFDERTFHQHLLNFIIADDQVCFHLTLIHVAMLMISCPDCQVAKSRGMSRI